MIRTIRCAFLLLCTLLLFACEKTPQAEAPPPDTLTREASGYYCLMTVVDHKGPKGHIFLSDRAEPLWFTSVRDTIAFTMSPEEPKNIAAIYVNDMAGADWNNPGRDNWIDARKAWYVIESDRIGGMGAPEAVPFSTKHQAEAFAGQYGGRVVDFDSIPAAFIR
jgi:copper chaperone NosL